MSIPSGSSSELNRLTSNWGVSLRGGEVLGDSEAALMVGGADGAPVRHLGILGFTSQYFSGDDIVTAGLEAINFSTAGILDVDEHSTGIVKSLIASSSAAGSLDAIQFQFLNDPAELQPGFPVHRRKPFGCSSVVWKIALVFPRDVRAGNTYC